MTESHVNGKIKVTLINNLSEFISANFKVSPSTWYFKKLSFIKKVKPIIMTIGSCFDSLLKRGLDEVSDRKGFASVFCDDSRLCCQSIFFVYWQLSIDTFVL